MELLHQRSARHWRANKTELLLLRFDLQLAGDFLLRRGGEHVERQSRNLGV